MRRKPDTSRASINAGAATSAPASKLSDRLKPKSDFANRIRQRVSCLTLSVVLCCAQTACEPRRSTNVQETGESSMNANEPARYEIIQSTIGVWWTFRLDRFTGRVFQLVETSNKQNAWREMRVADLVTNASPEKRVRFQLVTSTIAARETYLIDLDTGKTWSPITLTNDNGKELDTYWRAFVEK
jgi:hypothetical protein